MALQFDIYPGDFCFNGHKCIKKVGHDWRCGHPECIYYTPFPDNFASEIIRMGQEIRKDFLSEKNGSPMKGKE